MPKTESVLYRCTPGSADPLSNDSLSPQKNLAAKGHASCVTEPFRPPQLPTCKRPIQHLSSAHLHPTIHATPENLTWRSPSRTGTGTFDVDYLLRCNPMHIRIHTPATICPPLTLLRLSKATAVKNGWLVLVQPHYGVAPVHLDDLPSDVRGGGAAQVGGQAWGCGGAWYGAWSRAADAEGRCTGRRSGLWCVCGGAWWWGRSGREAVSGTQIAGLGLQEHRRQVGRQGWGVGYVWMHGSRGDGQPEPHVSHSRVLGGYEAEAVRLRPSCYLCRTAGPQARPHPPATSSGCPMRFMGVRDSTSDLKDSS